MKRHELKRMMAAMLCALMTASCAAPAALAEEYVALQSGSDIPGGSAVVFEPFSMRAAPVEGGLSVAVSGASPYEVEILVRSVATGESQKGFLPEGNGAVSFTLADGDYTVSATYVSDSYAQTQAVTLGGIQEGETQINLPESGSGDGQQTADPVIPAASGDSQQTADPIVPAASGDSQQTADPIVPAASGDSQQTADPIVPSASGDSQQGSGEITPPNSGSDQQGGTPSGSSDSPTGSVEPIVPPVPADDPPDEKITYSARLTALHVSESEADAPTGVIAGTVEFTGDLDMVAKLYTAAGTKEAEYVISKNGDGSFSFGSLAAGKYTLNFYFYGKGNETPPVSVDCTVEQAKPEGGESGSPAKPVCKRFTVTAASKSSGIVATIAGASSAEIEVFLIGADGKQVARGTIVGSGDVPLGAADAGVYTVVASYTAASVDDSGAAIDAVTTTVTVEKDAPVSIEASIETGKDYVLVTVTRATKGETMYIFFGDQDGQIIELGKTMRFENLKPGDYEIEIDYERPTGLAPLRRTVTIADPAVLKAISIQTVVAGENQLTVVGSAEPNTNVTLTTEPASSTTIIKTDAAGHFTVALTCKAGVYRKVTAQYDGDSTSAVSFAGEFTVTAPVERPTLTVDEVTTESTTVAAKTTPGTVVELRTNDYGQRVTADSDGLVRFTLPHTYLKGDKLTFTVYYGAANENSFTQEVTVVSATTYKQLKKGDKGDAVKRLTTRLKALGYPVSVTSTYSDSVVTAVYLFEKANGLKTDGVADSKMQAALYSVSAIPYSEETRYPTFVRGDRDHPLIYALQQRLKDLGYYTIRVDGIFGSGTQRAVRDFQRVNGLTVTGKADNATQTLLYSSAAKPAGSSCSGSYTTLTRSSRYQAQVVPLQRRLKQLGYYTGSVDGYFGSLTYRAVRNFQSRNGLDVTGKADPTTQEVLYSASAKPASGSSGSSGSADTGYRLLYWGCTGSAVKRLQNALIAAGYKSIVRTADGIYGQWTYDAVRAYQKDHGLAVDGIAGRRTQNSLYGTNY